MKHWKTLIIISILLIFSATLLPAKVTKTEKKTFDVKNGGTLTIKADRASIEVSTQNDEEVELLIKYKVKGSESLAEELIEKYKIDYDENGKDLSIETDYPNNSSWFGGSKYNNLQVKFELKVPQNYNVDLCTSGGSITVKDLDGEIYAKTSGGSLDFSSISGNILAKTSGGSISINLCGGNIDIKTSGGSIDISKCKGDVKAKTSGGGISVKEIYGKVNASTSGGSIYASIMEQPKGDCSLYTSGGGITVVLDKDINAYLDAKTSGGSVSTEFPIKFKGKVKRSSLEGELNMGGPEILLRTSGGSISIEEN